MGGWALVLPCRVLFHYEVSHHGTSVKVQHMMFYCSCVIIPSSNDPIFLLMDNSDSPSIVE